MRFKELIDGLRYHRKLIESEIQLSTYHELQEIHQLMRERAQNDVKAKKELDSFKAKAQQSLNELNNAESRRQDTVHDKSDIRGIVHVL